MALAEAEALKAQQSPFLLLLCTHFAKLGIPMPSKLQFSTRK